MKPEAYPIIQITPGMILADEPMGSKEKFWCELPADLGGGKWLFKQPRQDPGKMEHLSEKIAQELADQIGVPCARIQLAEFDGCRGTIALDVREPGEALIHGNEIIAGRVMGYDRQKRRRTSDHTFEQISQAILAVCGGRCEEDLSLFAGYLVLDALIGNTDRHHENWALLRRENQGSAAYRLAPSFDHASSLGREMLDDRRERLIREKRVVAYLEKARGAVFLAETGEKELAPGDLVRLLHEKAPGRFQRWFDNLNHVTPSALDDILTKLPEGWVTEPQRLFTKALVLQSKETLSQLRR